MNVVIILLLLLVVGFFVGYPLVKPEYEDDEIISNSAREKLKNEKEAVMTTLNEIEFDYKMGKLSDDDYEIMKNKYKIAAIEILKEEEANNTKKYKSSNEVDLSKEIDDEIERELKKIRVENNN